MNIVHEEEQSGGRYVARVDGVDGAALMTYSRTSPKLIIIDHTEVPDSMRGQGVGQALAKHVVEEARRGGWQIIPLCPFFRAQTLRHPEWSDVIKPRG